MRDYNLRVDPFDFISFEEITIHKQINQHAKAMVVGIISEEKEEEYLTSAVTDTIVSIYAKQEQSEQGVFTGMLDDLEIYSQGDLRKMKLSLISTTALMDMVEHTRTFQDTASSYDDTLKFLNYYPDYDYYMSVGAGQTIDKLIVQFKETDWEFVKRLSGHFNSFVLPNCQSGSVRYYFGLPSRTEKSEMEPVFYRMKKSVLEYTYKSKNQVEGIAENDSMYYEVYDRELREIGDKVIFRGNELYIYEIRTQLHKGELLHQYILKTLAGFKTKTCFNEKLIGASLDGSILDVKADVVKVSLNVDGGQLDDKAKWFAFSTVYSSPDGTGWYAMPEKGDAVRLYFPSEKEEEGYVINAVHLESSAEGLRSDPDNKSLRNRQNKEVQLNPTSIFMTNNNGMSITIDDEQGIFIESDKDIKIVSEKDVSIASIESSVSVLASEGVEIAKDEGKIIMSDDVIFTGQELDVQ